MMMAIQNVFKICIYNSDICNVLSVKYAEKNCFGIQKQKTNLKPHIFHTIIAYKIV